VIENEKELIILIIVEIVIIILGVVGILDNKKKNKSGV